MWDPEHNIEVLFVFSALLVNSFKYITVGCKLSKLVITVSFEDYSGQILFCCYEEEFLKDLMADHDPHSLNSCQAQTPNIMAAANEC